MKVLELMSGTGSIGKAFRALGAEVTSLDCDPKAGADICCDIMDWQPPPEGTYDVIWASPPCTEFTIALTRRPRQIEEGLRIVRRVMDIIELLKPKAWFIENPATGLLPKTPLCKDLPHRIVSYCKWDSPQHRYRKLTWIATNVETWHPTPPCCKASPCENVENGRHPECAQRGPVRCKEGLRGGRHKQGQLYSMPPKLCLSIATASRDWINQTGPGDTLEGVGGERGA